MTHEGTSQQGHYRSIVRDRSGWLECDDAKVKTAPPLDSFFGKNEKPYEASAYILVYGRAAHSDDVAPQDVCDFPSELGAHHEDERAVLERSANDYHQRKPPFERSQVALSESQAAISAGLIPKQYIYDVEAASQHEIAQLKMQLKHSQERNAQLAAELANAQTSVYRLLDIDGKRELRITCPGATFEDVEIIKLANGVAISIQGSDPRNPRGMPARQLFQKEFIFDKAEGCYKLLCSECCIQNGILTVVWQRSAPQLMRFNMNGQLEAVSDGQDLQIQTNSCANSFQMTYSRDPGMPVAEIVEGLDCNSDSGLGSQDSWDLCELCDEVLA